MTGDRHYSLSFPDVENCFPDGETLIEAVEMAQDALSLLSVLEDKGEPTYPNILLIDAIWAPDGASMVLVQKLIPRKRVVSFL
jgi:antitoxin HicB